MTHACLNVCRRPLGFHEICIRVADIDLRICIATCNIILPYLVIGSRSWALRPKSGTRDGSGGNSVRADFRLCSLECHSFHSFERTTLKKLFFFSFLRSLSLSLSFNCTIRHVGGARPRLTRIVLAACESRIERRRAVFFRDFSQQFRRGARSRAVSNAGPARREERKIYPA